MDTENQESNETSKPWPNSIKAQVKFLLHETLCRNPGQQYPKETLKAWQEDWAELAAEIGIERFKTALKMARDRSKFFPAIADIREYIPPVPMRDGERWNHELKDLQRRKAAGEKFYTLSDVFSNVASMIRTGKIKPSNPSWFEWAKQFKGKNS